MGGKAWTTKEIELLKAVYSVKSKEEILELFSDKNWQSVKHKAYKLNISRNYYWSAKEIELLKTFYPNTDKKEILLNFPSRTWDGIQAQAIKLKINRLLTFNESVFSLANNINSYYAGFIAADGSISDSNNLQIVLQARDIKMLSNFNSFMQCTRKISEFSRLRKNKIYKEIRVTYQSKILAEDLNNNFLIKPRKTLNCPFPSHLSFDNKLSYIIGNLDGDGCISTTHIFSIQWLGDFKFLSYIRNLFFSLNWIPNNTKYLRKLTETGLYELKFSGETGKKVYRKLIRHIEINNLPVMERKWFNRGVRYVPYAMVLKHDVKITVDNF